MKMYRLVAGFLSAIMVLSMGTAVLPVPVVFADTEETEIIEDVTADDEEDSFETQEHVCDFKSYYIYQGVTYSEAEWYGSDGVYTKMPCEDYYEYFGLCECGNISYHYYNQQKTHTCHEPLNYIDGELVEGNWYERDFGDRCPIMQIKGTCEYCGELFCKVQFYVPTATAIRGSSNVMSLPDGRDLFIEYYLGTDKYIASFSDSTAYTGVASVLCEDESGIQYKEYRYFYEGVFAPTFNGTVKQYGTYGEEVTITNGVMDGPHECYYVDQITYNGNTYSAREWYGSQYSEFQPDGIGYNFPCNATFPVKHVCLRCGDVQYTTTQKKYHIRYGTHATIDGVAVEGEVTNEMLSDELKLVKQDYGCKICDYNETTIAYLSNSNSNPTASFLDLTSRGYIKVQYIPGTTQFIANSYEYNVCHRYTGLFKIPAEIANDGYENTFYYFNDGVFDPTFTGTTKQYGTYGEEVSVVNGIAHDIHACSYKYFYRYDGFIYTKLEWFGYDEGVFADSSIYDTLPCYAPYLAIFKCEICGNTFDYSEEMKGHSEKISYYVNGMKYSAAEFDKLDRSQIFLCREDRDCRCGYHTESVAYNLPTTATYTDYVNGVDKTNNLGYVDGLHIIERVDNDKVYLTAHIAENAIPNNPDMKCTRYTGLVEFKGIIYYFEDGALAPSAVVDYNGEKYDVINGLLSPHVHTVVVDKAVVATTTRPGLTEGSHCPCGLIYVAQEETPMYVSGVDNFCERLYTCALNREAEGGPTGKDNWIEQISMNGLDGATAAHGFFFSDEFKNSNVTNEEFVKRLYNTFLDRNPDPEGLNTWITLLEKGVDREEIFNGFVNSTEWANVCLTYGIESGGNAEPTITVTPSEQIIAFVERLYSICLKRDGDPAGIMAWTTSLANREITGTEYAFGIFFSEEFQGKGYTVDETVEILYQSVLGRSADPLGKESWIEFFEKGASFTEVFYGFVQSQEFTKICSDYGIVR